MYQLGSVRITAKLRSVSRCGQSVKVEVISVFVFRLMFTSQ